MDIIEFMLKTLGEIFGWILKMLIKLVFAIVGGIFDLVISTFKGSENS